MRMSNGDHCCLRNERNDAENRTESGIGKAMLRREDTWSSISWRPKSVKCNSNRNGRLDRWFGRNESGY